MAEVSGETNARHLEDPKSGDFWNEMMMPCLVVIATNERGVLICDATLPVGDNHWKWDFDKVRTIPKAELREAVRYCFCYPEFHKNVAQRFAEHLGLHAAAAEGASPEGVDTQ